MPRQKGQPMNETLDRRRFGRWKARALLLVPIALLCSLAVPHFAYAGILGDWLNVEGMITGVLIDWSEAWFNLYFSILGEVSNADFIQGAFTNLFGTEEPYRVISSFHQTAVIPIAQAILGLFMLMQLIKISQRIDATSTLPAVKDIVFLVVIYCLMSWFINHSLEVVQAIYDIFNGLIDAMAQQTGSPASLSAVSFTDEEKSGATIGGAGMLLILSLLSVVIGIAAYIVSMVVALARAIQIYVLAAMSPIPIALMGFEETKQMGIGYLKNFAAICLAGVIMMLILYLYPHVVSSLVVDAGGIPKDEMLAIIRTQAVNFDMTAAFLKWAATSIVLIIGLVKSGAWARDILGS